MGGGIGGWRYPMIQFDASAEGGVVTGLGRVVATLADESGWMALAFLLSPEERLGGERPIDTLRAGGGARVLEMAKMLGEHGAY